MVFTTEQSMIHLVIPARQNSLLLKTFAMDKLLKLHNWTWPHFNRLEINLLILKHQAFSLIFKYLGVWNRLRYHKTKMCVEIQIIKDGMWQQILTYIHMDRKVIDTIKINRNLSSVPAALIISFF